MRRLVSLCVVAMAMACSHEHEAVARALGCPLEQTSLVAAAAEHPFATARETQSTAAALAGAAATFAAMASMVGAHATSPAYYLPPGSMQLSAPGWRHYEGCSKAMLCFDGGFCSRSEDAELLPLARTVPALMRRSMVELGGLLEVHGECGEPLAIGDRRGLLAWSLSRCGATFGCKVEDASYTCSDEKGRKVEAGAR